MIHFKYLVSCFVIIFIATSGSISRVKGQLEKEGEVDEASRSSTIPSSTSTSTSTQTQTPTPTTTTTTSDYPLELKPKTDPAKDRPEQLTVIAPKKLRPRSDYHVLVNLANSQVPVSIDISLTAARDSNQEQTEAKSILVSSGETQTIKFTIGDWPSALYSLNVSAIAIDRSWNYTQEVELEYEEKTFSILIQTDKAIYRPGEEIKFRSIFLKQTLAPLVIKDNINVTIYDPKKNIAKRWTELSNYRGLISLDYQLSEDPMLGLWTIRVEAQGQTNEKQFQIAEYILPTFDVNIKLPSYATYNQSDIIATVKATYTFGKPVNGHVTLTVQPLVRFSWIRTRPLESQQHKAALKNGEADFSIDLVKELKLERELFPREIEFFALVEEEDTGRKYNKTERLSIHHDDIKIELINRDKGFKPGLSRLFQFKIAYQDDTPVEDNGPEMTVKFSSSGNQLNETRLRPVAGLCETIIDIPKKINDSQLTDRETEISYLSIQVNYRDQVHHLDPISAFKTKSEQYMQIDLPQLTQTNRRFRSQITKRSIDINQDLKVQISSTEPMQQVTCQCIARGDIIWALSRDAKNATRFEFEAKVDRRMAPEARILCFYIRPDNKEIIADSIKFPVSGLIRNAVKLSTSRSEARPGQEVEVDVLTKPNSLVGVLGIDQSVLLLRSGNDITKQDIDKEIKSYQGSSENSFPSSNTESLFGSSDVVIITNNLVYDGYSYRIRYLFDSPNVIREMVAQPLNRAVSGDIRLDPSINNQEINPPEFHLSKQKSEPLVIRSKFPETWLWENATAGSDGLARFKSKVPDTITSWVLSGFSINEEIGFGLSDGKNTVRVFRPFFIKMNLPYSIIRGEVVNIQAIVFNYGKNPISATVTMKNDNQDFEFVEASNDIDDEKLESSRSQTRNIRISPQDGAPVSFLIKPNKLGLIEILLTARSDFAADGISKKLLVKPEGQVQHRNKAFLIDLPGPQSTIKQNFSIDVPPNAVPGSQKVYVSAIGDILGPGLSNIDDLLRLPYGCGEQNMINLVPNIVIMNYLQSSRRLKDSQRVRAIRNIESGYQRQLNYKRKDGAFSAFGDIDKNGSVWLTAYVLKTFQQARPLISVDEKVLNRATKFIAEFSKSDGSIEEVGMLHDKRLQSSAAGSSIYLTAYAMIALLQRPIKVDPEDLPIVPLDEVIQRGLGYIEKKVTESADQLSTYDLAISAYALQLANRKPAMDDAYRLLWSRANQNGDGLTWWTDNTNSGSHEIEGENAKLLDSPEDATLAPTTVQPPLKPIPPNKKHSAHLFLPDSLEIEMTALALMTTVKSGELDRALPIVRWLIEKQNSNGGFVSTQDTVLAIEALATFAAASSKANPSIDVELIYERQGKSKSEIRRNSVDEILITGSNALVNQRVQLPDNLTWIQLQASGSGAGVVQVSWQYNLLVSAEKPAFYLNPTVDRTSNRDYLQLSVCTFYKAGEKSNMAVVEVDLPSGFVADSEAISSLRRTKEIKRVDKSEGDTKVIIYLESVTRDEICFTIPAHRTTKVSNNKPVPVTIYDYYNRQKTARIFYEPQIASSCDICDSESCKSSCSSKPKQTSQLLSLHEQRRLNSNRGRNRRAA